MRLTALTAFALALGVGSAASASTNLITNGGFGAVDPSLTALVAGGVYNGAEISNTYTVGSTSYDFRTAVTGWTSPRTAGPPFNQAYNLWESGVDPTGKDAVSEYPGEQQRVDVNFPGLSPDGGAFMILDGDPTFTGPLEQTVNGLVVGDVYSLSFYWAGGELSNRVNYISNQLHVSFSDGTTTQTYSTLKYLNTALPGQPGSFTPWMQVKTSFKATSTSEVLSFLSDGAPGGNLPPVALLDGVSLTVPEPAVWGLMVLGFGGVGAMIRRRRLAAA
ncbi:PEP-CTERM sorting domain-containing protein [Phenylobacterium sp.]|uniref:PEP-CTERM sorting domain-containing protein n=1 Tax=Phenylobacterium sp. TaxID=1871053 RepID=UPI002C5B3C15|nr:PEP-CTERM sorting domain-containing protein [Phenylobacterium sp.]HLZ76029.1 PEP-CTERM sorting domain-containing protein [Phenylobacterium sp.]